MVESGKNSAVIIGHPAHVLRIYRFVEIYQPIVFVLTDGSGTSGRSKSQIAADVVEECGAKTSHVFGRFADAEMYKVMRDQDLDALTALVDDILFEFERNNVELVVGDAAEGFNPTHDLCRYLTNAIARVHSSRSGKAVKNFDFLLDGPPDVCPSVDPPPIRITLSETELSRKKEAIERFPDIKPDIDQFFRNFGEAGLKTECLRPVANVNGSAPSSDGEPFYERYGSQKVKEGLYPETISFEKHLRPLAEFLTHYPL